MSEPVRLAYFSPLPPAHTGIADYSAELLPALGRLAEVALFVEQPETVAEPLATTFPIFPLAAYPAQRWDYDIAVYQMGNSRFHGAMAAVYRHHPGILVLHDFGLHHFVASQTLDRGDFPGYLREMAYALGPEGLRQARAVRDGRQPPPFFAVPLNDRLLDLSLGVIVHSDYVRRRLLTIAGLVDRSIAVIPAPIGRPVESSKREQLGWGGEFIVFGSFGLVTSEKQLDRALQAFARLRDTLPQARYLIVGDWRGTGVDLAGLIEALSLRDVVHCTGYIHSLADFAGWIAAADIAVNLRAPTVGETSAAALRALAAGRPLIVYDHGWYAELPDTVCLKVPPGDDDALLAAMIKLGTDQELRRKMGRQAAEFAVQVHAPARAAAAYVAFIERVLAGLRPSWARGHL